MEVEHSRLHAWPVAHARADRTGELAPRRLPARPAPKHREPMLRHPELGRHDLHDLLAAVAHDLSRVERGVTASTLPWTVLDDAVGVRGEPERLPMVPDLSARSPARGAAQAPRPLRLRRVRRGRLAGVVRVLRQQCLQLGVAALEAEVMPLKVADLGLEPLVARPRIHLLNSTVGACSFLIILLLVHPSQSYSFRMILLWDERPQLVERLLIAVPPPPMSSAL